MCTTHVSAGRPRKTPRCAFALAIGATLASTAVAAELLVPAYQYPTLGTLWADCAAAAPSVSIGVIMNPASGPGTVADSNYLAVIAAVRASGGRIYGYVDTAYANRPIGDVMADVSQYVALYAVSDGIFLDQMANAPGNLAYYQSLAAAIHAALPGARVIANPGTSVPESFIALGAADVIVTYENNVSGVEPYAGATPPAWTAAHPARRFCNIVYNVPHATGLAAVLALADARNVGSIYVTNRILPNPYDELPPYWPEVVAGARVLLPASAGDIDGDGHVDLADVAQFQSAFAGRNTKLPAGQEAADCDSDWDADADDFAVIAERLG